MGSKEIKQLHEQLEQQKQQVAQSPEAARKLLENLGIINLPAPPSSGTVDRADSEPRR